MKVKMDVQDFKLGVQVVKEIAWYKEKGRDRFVRYRIEYQGSL